VTFGFGRVPDVFDFAVGADQKRAADGARENAAHEFLGTPDAVGFDHFAGWIANQRKIQLLFGLEFGERGFGIGAGAENYRVQLVEFFLCVTKLGRFGGSTGSVGFGEEKQNDAFAREVLQRDLASSVGFQREVWGFLSNFQHRFNPGAATSSWPLQIRAPS
jgi:hypothetical protein